MTAVYVPRRPTVIAGEPEGSRRDCNTIVIGARPGIGVRSGSYTTTGTDADDGD
jgi:hypothetical protein